jgi:hypothetical protein
MKPRSCRDVCPYGGEEIARICGCCLGRRSIDMKTKGQWAVTYVVRGEFAFLLFTGVCVALHPGIVLKWNEGGMSNYGLHLKTAVP